MRLRRRLVMLGVAVGIALIGFAVWWSRSEWVDAGEAAVLYRVQGGLESRVIRPGRIWVPFWSTLYKYPTAMQEAVYTNDPMSGEVKAADAINVTTNENANTAFDVVVWYHVAPENVITVFSNFKNIPIEVIQSQHIRGAVRQAVQDIGTQYDAFSLMGERRPEASKKLTKRLKELLEYKGITVDRADFAGASPAPEIAGRITSQVNALTNLRISEISNQMARINRDTAIIKATATSKAQNLAAGSAKAKSLEFQSVELDIQALEKWNGHVPPIMVRPGQNVTITPGMLEAVRREGK
jgi:hypothetical protein